MTTASDVGVAATVSAAEAIGLDLGTRVVAYRDFDAILYALAVGALPTDLDLVFERDLRVLPTYGLALGRWACDALCALGFWSPVSAVHGAQRLEVLAPLPREGRLELHGRVAAVWDKGSAAVFDIEVGCEQFRAVYSVFAPGRGGFGGERGPSAPRTPDTPPTRVTHAETWPAQAALYRLTGDRHLIHIDPAAAGAIGQPGPILHGLCTLGMSARELAGLLGHHPADLTHLDARFSAPVSPGETLELRVWDQQEDGAVPFVVATERATVLSGRAIHSA